MPSLEFNDNVRSPLMKEWLKNEANPVDKEDMQRHDKWLCMMWPRLHLLRELLSVEGFIFKAYGQPLETLHLRDEGFFVARVSGYAR